MRLWVSPFLISSYILRHQHDVPSSVIKGCNIRAPGSWASPTRSVSHVLQTMSWLSEYSCTIWENGASSMRMCIHKSTFLFCVSFTLSVCRFKKTDMKAIVNQVWITVPSSLFWIGSLFSGLVSSSFWLFCLIFSMYSTSHC